MIDNFQNDNDKRFWQVQQSGDPNLLFDGHAGGVDEETEVGEQVPIPGAVDDYLWGKSGNFTNNQSTTRCG